MTFIEILATSLLTGFWTSLGLAFNEWLFKRRIEKMLTKFEKNVKKSLKNGGKKV